MEKRELMLEADYLVIGAGASGMAFVDEMIHSTLNETIIIVDKHSKPGGHWNDAYDFVRLHQPAGYYGVNSKHLGRGSKDLASFSEICLYYDLVMKDLLSTGRVKYFPLCEYEGNNVFYSMMERTIEYKVNVRKKAVDATCIGPSIPSVSKPEFTISGAVNLIPVNGLSRNQHPWEKYVVIGGGKTGIDAVLFLLDHSVNPERIMWIIPNDCWLRNRNDFFDDQWFNAGVCAMNCMLECENYDELLTKWENIGYLMRLDTNVKPTVMRGGLVTPCELKRLRLVKDVVRKGRVKHIDETQIIFQNGELINICEDTLHVDCSAAGARPFATQNIFNGRCIIIQDVRLLQSVYSASAIAAIESLYPDDEGKKNQILKPLMHPQTPSEYIVCVRDEHYIEEAIAKHLGVSWFRKSRLHPLHHISFIEYIKYIMYVRWNGKKLADVLEKMVGNIEGK